MLRQYKWKREPVKDPRNLKVTRHLNTSVLPEEFELPKIPVYNQGEQSSCTSNAGSNAFRYEYFQLKGKFNNPSRAFTYYQTRLLEGTQNEDAGAYCKDVFKSMNKFGVCDESLMPYNDKVFAQKPSQKAYEDALNNLVVKYTEVPKDLSTIKQVLTSGACVLFGMDIYASFEQGNWDSTTGIMPLPKPGEELLGGHALILVGYSNVKQCFLVQNSWGTSWGLQGRFWIPYSYILSNHADDFWCIDSIQIKDTPYPVTTDTNIDIKSVIVEVKDLTALNKTLLYRLAKALKLDPGSISKPALVSLIQSKLGF